MAVNTLDPDTLEWVVQEVLRRLQLHEAADAPAAAPVGADELAVGERVVTLATLERRLDGVARLVVTRQAVVTPAVKDELRDRNIELIRK